MSALSPLGFGVTGPHATPLVTREATISLVHQAISAGIRVFDTGPMYGDGEAEMRLGTALRSTPATDGLFVITKARTRSKSGERISVRASFEQSLVRLGVSRVNALLLHGPEVDDLSDSGILAELGAIRSENLVDRLGVCGRGAERGAMLQSARCGDLFSLLMSPLDDRSLLELARERGIDVLAIETMRSQRSAFRLPSSTADLWYLARAARDAALGRLSEPGIGIEAALQWPGVASVIVTTTRAEHLNRNAQAAGLPAA